VNLLIRLTALLAGLAASTAPPAQPASPSPAANEPPASTYLFEWTTRTGAASRRLTLFSDAILVRKSVSPDGKTEIKKRKLSPEEYSFYSDYFGSPESREGAGNFETGLTGDQSARSEISFAPPGAARWSLTFDSFSALSGPAARVKSALEGLLDSFGKVLPNEEDFPIEKLVPGTLLRRRDGQEFRVVHVDEGAKIVEARAVGQPYSQFFQWSKLRYSFYPP
jgi:hypothetical protein